MMVGEVVKQLMTPADVVTIQNVLSAWDKDFPNTSTSTTAVLLSVWFGITLDNQSSPPTSSSDSLDVNDPAFDAFPVPTSQQTYLQLSTNVFGRLGLVLPLLCFYLMGWRLPHKRLARVVDGIVGLLFLLTAALVIPLILAKQSFNQQSPLFTAPRDASVNASFNEFYCNARGAELCGVTAVIHPRQDAVVPIEKLLSVFNGVARANGDNSNATLAMANVVRGCLYIFTNQYDLHQKHLDIRSSLRQQQAFLKRCNASDATDNWCGEYILTSTLGFDRIAIRLGWRGATECRASESQWCNVDNFVRAWQTRFELDGILLGIVGVVLLLFCVSWVKMLESDKRPAVALKLEKHSIRRRVSSFIGMALAAGSDDSVEICDWGCAMCTFENESAADKCAICLTPRRKTPVKAVAALSLSSRSSPSDGARSAKKLRASSNSNGGMLAHKQIQKPLVAVGSSNEKEALRLKKKIEQMKELGIDLPSNDMLALLARNCYSVMAAVSAYFEQMAATDAPATMLDAEAERRIASTCSFFENSFACEPFRLLGSRVMSATLNRSSVSMRVGDRLVLQAENAGKKRLRLGAAAGTGSSPASSASSLSAGIVRVATAQDSLIGRLDRDMETIFQPLMKVGLVTLGGVCQSTPASSQMFASFNVLVFVFVSTKAFSIFHEEHPQFYLSDALYAALDMLQPESTDSSAPASTESDNGLNQQSSSVEDKDAGLEALFSDFIGSNADDEDAQEAENGISPADQLAPLLKDITLRDHQKTAVRWMLARENQNKKQTGRRATASSSDEKINPMWEARKFHKNESSYFINRFEKIASLKTPQPPTPCLGGILADDMGMGKTMMMLALTACQKHFGDTDESTVTTSTTTTSGMMKRPRAYDNSRKTLIVCPLSLLHQWKNEIDERFRANTLNVHIYYGDDREGNVATLGSMNKSDVVLTTYGVLSKEFEKPNGGGALVTGNWLRVILDEAHSIKNRMTTYFKACASLRATHRWCLTGTPIQNSLDDLFSLLCFLQYESWSRLSWWKRVVAVPFEQGDEKNALGRLKVVLTPILLRRTKHTRDRHGKNIVQLPPKHMELVKLTFSEEERTFYQAVYDKSRAEFNGFVATGTASTSYVAIFALLLRLRQACNHPFLALGRNFEEAQSSNAAAAGGGNGKDASSSVVSLFQPQQNESMESYYRRISARLQQDMHDSSSSGGGAATKDASTLLAEANDNIAGGSRTGGLTKSYIANVLAQVEEGLESHECPVCLDPPVSGVLTACAHVLCEQCLRDSLANDPESGCPVCRAVVDMTKVFVLPTPAPRAQEEDDEQVQSEELSSATTADEDAKPSGVFMSTKLKQLLHDLQVIRRENEQSVGVAKKRKVVVFSQWTYMLEMITKLLQAHGFAHCMFHGAMNQETRERVLTRFAKEPALDVLVISLKAGGVGLNLTCASVVILMDPWWNPGVEDQAIDRVHRLGQDQDVIVKRYVVDETVEDMILQLQQRKEKLAKHVLVASKSGDDKRSERLSLEDLKSFFR